MNTEPVTLTQPECARLLGVSVRTIRRLVAEGTLKPVYLHPRGHPRIRRADIERLIRVEEAVSPP